MCLVLLLEVQPSDGDFDSFEIRYLRMCQRSAPLVAQRVSTGGQHSLHLALSTKPSSSSDDVDT
eukprot:1012257-Amphidinium_carterae.1